ncbi:hypothetical protein A4X09_0g7074 [Tilletia walkeri]|uniref:Uncharacterized protein n=1 Tax=Tilletia walkeri TaxID=117179 RepID=A0A8X7T213_9BASI|nr:hypothetical protein A4X09_0g7074 [Tilletia walkeri]
MFLPSSVPSWIGAAEPRSARFGDGSGARATVQGPQDHGWGAASSQYAKTMIVKIQGPVLQHPQDNGDGAAAATLRRQNAAGYLKAKAKNRCGGTKVPDLQRKPRMLTIQGPEALRDKDWAGLLTLSSLSVFESQEAFLREAFEEDGARAKKEQEDAEKKEKSRLRKENDRLKEENARLKEDSARIQEENTRLRKESTAAGKGKRKASDTGLGGVPSTSAGVEASTTPMRIGVPAEVTETEALATLSTPAFPSGVFLQIIQSRSSRRGLETARWIVIDYGGLTEQGEHILGVKTKGKAREITAVISRCVKTRAQQRQDGPRSAEVQGVRTRLARDRSQLMIGTAGGGPRPVTYETIWRPALTGKVRKTTANSNALSRCFKTRIRDGTVNDDRLGA